MFHIGKWYHPRGCLAKLLSVVHTIQNVFSGYKFLLFPQKRRLKSKCQVKEEEPVVCSSELTVEVMKIIGYN